MFKRWKSFWKKKKSTELILQVETKIKERSKEQKSNGPCGTEALQGTSPSGTWRMTWVSLSTACSWERCRGWPKLQAGGANGSEALQSLGGTGKADEMIVCEAGICLMLSRLLYWMKWLSGWATRYDLVACGRNGNGRTVGLGDLVGPFQPCDSMIPWNGEHA